MGALVGLLVSWLLKVFNLNYDPIKECTIMIMFAYLSYLVAEQTALSGIISLFSCGLFMAHYAYWNISKRARVGTEMAVCTIANCNQSFLYIYMGLSAFSIEPEYVEMKMVWTTLIAIFVCRIFSVGVPIFLVWCSTGCQPLKLRWNEWVFVYCGGLIRGAIAFGLGLQMTTDNHRVLKNTVQICALITIVGVGAPIQLLAKIFNIKPDKERAAEAAKKRLEAGTDDFLKVPDGAELNDATSTGNLSKNSDTLAACEDEGAVIDKINESFEQLIQEKTYPKLIQAFKDFDKNYMMPLFKRTNKHLLDELKD